MLLTGSVLSLSHCWPDKEQPEPIPVLAGLGMERIHAAPALECIISIQELQLPIPVLFLDASIHRRKVQLEKMVFLHLCVRKVVVTPWFLVLYRTKAAHLGAGPLWLSKRDLNLPCDLNALIP